MVREITYTVTKDTKGIVPATKQWAGMQYEDNATKVIFDLSELITTLDAAKTYKYRIDFNSSSAGYDPSGELKVSDNKISREIPAKFTQYGGEIQITAVITEKDDSMVCYSFPVTVFFTAVKKEAFSEAEIVKNISAMEEELKEFAEDKKEEIEKTVDNAETDIKNEVEVAKSDIQTAAENARANIANDVREFQSYSEEQKRDIDERATKANEAADISETAKNDAEKSAESAQKSALSAEEKYLATVELRDEVETSAPKIYTGTRVGSYGSPSDDYSDMFMDNPDVVNAKIGDLYINTDTHRVYQCVEKQGGADDFMTHIEWKSLNIEGKEDIANKITDLFVDNEGLGKEQQYPTALAVKTYTDEKVLEAVSGKEDTANKVSSMDTVTDETNEYPNVKAVRNYYDVTASALQEDYNSKLNGKVDKGEGANAIKGKAEGNPILLNDVSPIEHTLDVRVSQLEPKNIIPNPYDSCAYGSSTTIDGLTFTVDSNGVITTSGVYNGETGDSFNIKLISSVHPTEPYLLARGATYSFDIIGSTNGELGFYAIIAVWRTELDENGDPVYVVSEYDRGSGCEITVPDEEDYTGNYELNIIVNMPVNYVVGSNGETYTFRPTMYLKSSNEFEGVTVKVSDGTTEKQYVPNADGIVEGVKSISPTMIISTDTEGANIELAYNQDSNAFKGNVETDLQELDKVTAELISGKVDKEEGKTLYRGFELIYEHNLTAEEVEANQILITKDINGNDFKLDEIYLYLFAPNGVTASGTVSGIFNGGSGSGYYWFSKAYGTAAKQMQAYGRRMRNGIWFNLIGAPANALYGSSVSGGYISSSTDYVTRLEINGTNLFTEGTRIRFFGRRVD